MQFHETRMGERFYEGTMPQLVKQLMRLNDNMENNNSLMNRLLADRAAETDAIVAALGKKERPSESMIPAERMETLLINAFERAIDDSDAAVKVLIRSTGITSEELEKFGYDKVNFPIMHGWVKSPNEEVFK